ncbi:hypothetical protein N665_0033s0057 [Sinapis alba]|nr:hypothetical protein N665_0033s0057 [Sinapis alba]
MDSTSTVDRDTNNKDDEGEIQTPTSGGKRKETPPTSGASSQPSKVKRLLPTRSDVWVHYTRTKEDRDKCLCNHCQNTFSCLTSSGTSNLRKHLEVCKNHLSWSAGQKNKQPVIDDDGKLKKSLVTEGQFREATNQMMVIGQLPLSFVESVAWKHFVDKTTVFTPHSRRTATKDIVKIYVERKEALKKWFLCNKQRVSLTTDIWVSQTTGYLLSFNH